MCLAILRATITAPRDFALVSRDKDGDFGQEFELRDRSVAFYEAYSARGRQPARTFDVPTRPSRTDDRREFDGRVSRAAPVTDAIHA